MFNIESFAQFLFNQVSFLVNYVEEGNKYEAPNNRKNEENERLRGAGDQIKFIDLRFERWQVVGLSELCWEKATVANTKHQRKKKEREMLRGERD